MAAATTALLGRLARVDVRDIWITEAGHFTPWLAREENIELLGETIGVELEVEAQEKAVGPFRADILCKNAATDEWVLIENQLERTDHTHLGQLLTYAAGLEAVTIVWVAPTFTDEHRAALDWLNTITDERFNFFGLEVELWRIGTSPIAPKFNIVSQPNGWAKSIAQGAKALQSAELTETKQLQLEYWAALRQVVDSGKKLITSQKPLAQHWTNYSIGRSGFQMSAQVNTVKNRILVCLTINHGSFAKAYFNLLLQQKADIEAEIGAPLQWLELQGRKESRIELARENTDPWQRDDWPHQHAWLLQNLEKLHQSFAARIKAITAAYPQGVASTQENMAVGGETVAQIEESSRSFPSA